MLEANEMEKKKRKKKKKASKSSNNTSDSTLAAAIGGADVLAKADRLSDIGQILLTSKYTDKDSSSKTGTSESVKDKPSKPTTPDGDSTKKLTESGESLKSDSDTLDKERERNDDTEKSSDKAKLTQTESYTENCLKEQGAAESAVGSAPLKLNDSLEVLSGSKGTSAMKQKIKQSISTESTESGGGGVEVEPVAKEEGEVARDMTEGAAARKKLHTCGLCGREEVTAKTFKRCQK
jgi:hypothetical protein